MKTLLLTLLLITEANSFAGTFDPEISQLKIVGTPEDSIKKSLKLESMAGDMGMGGFGLVVFTSNNDECTNVMERLGFDETKVDFSRQPSLVAAMKDLDLDQYDLEDLQDAGCRFSVCGLDSPDLHWTSGQSTMCYDTAGAYVKNNIKEKDFTVEQEVINIPNLHNNGAFLP